MNEQTPSESSPEMLPATRRSRLLLCASLLLVLVFFLLCQFVAIPVLKTALSTATRSDLIIVKSILAGFSFIAMLAGLATLLYGRKILRSGQYPPNNAWVWRDTHIQRGRIAIRFGWAHVATGILMAIIGIGSALYIWRLIDQALPHSNSKRHYIILQQKSLN
ncbi:MAG: hypothetical protein ACXWJD_06970 [Burkholderiaceae bacterium]